MTLEKINDFGGNDQKYIFMYIIPVTSLSIVILGIVKVEYIGTCIVGLNFITVAIFIEERALFTLAT